MATQNPAGRQQILKGAGLLLLGHLLTILYRIQNAGPQDGWYEPFYLIGLWQWFYVIPGALIALWRKQDGIAQGITIAAVATFVLNFAAIFFIYALVLMGIFAIIFAKVRTWFTS